MLFYPINSSNIEVECIKQIKACKLLFIDLDYYCFNLGAINDLACDSAARFEGSECYLINLASLDSYKYLKDALANALVLPNYYFGLNLENAVFKTRYLQRNVGAFWYNSIGFNAKKNPHKFRMWAFKRARNLANKSHYLKRKADKFLSNYFKKRALSGKIDIPYFELVLTTKCTLNCQSCNNLMQYFSPQNQYSCSLDGILGALKAFLSKVSRVFFVRVIGGEPLLFKQIDSVAKYLENHPKICSFDIVTNGTIMPKNELLGVMEHSFKGKITISDYGNLSKKRDVMIDELKARKIAYEVLWANNEMWFAPGKIYKRNRNRDEIIKNFLACGMVCVSISSNENSKNNKGGVFVCPIAHSLSKLRGVDEFVGDFIDLGAFEIDDILEFYAKKYFSCCDYCRNMWEKPQSILPAVQTKEILNLEP